MGRINTRKFKRFSIATKPEPERVSMAGLIKATGPSKRTELTSLSSIAVTGNKKEVPGRKYSGVADILAIDTAEYLYLTNSYITRGTNTNAAAVMRNGLELVPLNVSDQKALDLILQYNDIDLLVYDIAKNCELYGVQFVELYQDSEAATVRFELLPTVEMDYLRDSAQNVIYDKKAGRPKGYVQKRDGITIAEWNGKDALRIAEFKYNTLGGCITGIPGIQSALYPASEYGYIRNSIADSFIRSLPVAHVKVEGATPDDIEEVTAAVNDKFTSRTTYVTSERFTIENTAPSNDIDVFKFIEPTIAEIAACFCMPVEMLAGTQYLKSNDFVALVQEWVEHIKVKQKKIASVFEHQVFSILFTDPIKVRFNNPTTITTTELINNVGFAVQSGALTPELALEILAKNQVFGAYTSSLVPIVSDKNGTASKTEPAGKVRGNDVNASVPAE